MHASVSCCWSAPGQLVHHQHDLGRLDDGCNLISHLDAEVYLSLIAHAEAVVGNSSAGLYEAPSFGTPTINVGDRQHGRPMAKSVVTCTASADAITFWLNTILKVSHPKGPAPNPFGDGHACERIVSVIGEIKEPKTLLRKRFYDVAEEAREAWRDSREIERE